MLVTHMTWFWLDKAKALELKLVWLSVLGPLGKKARRLGRDVHGHAPSTAPGTAQQQMSLCPQPHPGTKDGGLRDFGFYMTKTSSVQNLGP